MIFNETEHLVAPVGILAGGFAADAVEIGADYKAHKDTPAMKARKINDNLAFGDEKKKGDLPFGGTLQVFGHHADTVAASPMPRRGTPIEVGRDMAAKEIPIMELFKRLRDAGVTITRDMNADLRGRLGGSVAVGLADEIVAALVDGKGWAPDVPEAQAM